LAAVALAGVTLSILAQVPPNPQQQQGQQIQQPVQPKQPTAPGQPLPPAQPQPPTAPGQALPPAQPKQPTAPGQALPPGQPGNQQIGQGTQVQGRIISADQNTVVLQTKDGRRVTLNSNDATRYWMNNQAGKFSDLRVGTDITAYYTTEGDRFFANTFTNGNVQAVPVPGGQAQGTLVTGQVVRVVGRDQVVVRTSDGKEVIVFVSPDTAYMFNNQPSQFTELRPGTDINVYYDVRDGRHLARRILWGRR